ncbi:hypothetical protein TD95_000632 [Thielaviopsis punctulata]|uniref:HpcH/HpaI aldolase/citrate lyase domain-containing protein n=1 Tax=Thielaviopsis punctulata TaxID=72032 RepID=A0A0F4ZKU2_9PEZI|nr:hypothetical protein TD95_000632 [Thielaviopsis punctulata]
MSASAAGIVRRSLLYVPSSSSRMLAKSLHLNSDNITYDLEDSVAPHQKPAARALLTAHLAHLSSDAPAWPTPTEVCARINPVNSPHALADIAAVAGSQRLDALLVPKVSSAADLTFVTDVLRHVCPARHPPLSDPAASTANAQPLPHRPPIKLIALIESARAITDLREICTASPYLSGLVFAAEDFALDLSLTRTPALTEFLYARSAIVTAARAFNLPSVIDLVCTEYKGEAGQARLREECENGRGMGFNGKQCIHPSQVGLVQELFAPPKADLEWAARVTIANAKAEAQDRGAWTLDGKMIDAPVVGKAQALLKRGAQCGINIELIKDQWKNQLPE